MFKVAARTFCIKFYGLCLNWKSIGKFSSSQKQYYLIKKLAKTLQNARDVHVVAVFEEFWGILRNFEKFWGILRNFLVLKFFVAQFKVTSLVVLARSCSLAVLVSIDSKASCPQPTLLIKSVSTIRLRHQKCLKTFSIFPRCHQRFTSTELLSNAIKLSLNWFDITDIPTIICDFSRCVFQFLFQILPTCRHVLLKRWRWHQRETSL